MPKKAPIDPRAATDTDRAIGERIRLLRLQRDLSQTKLAEAIGVTFQQVQKYEKGVNRISVGTLIRICDVLNVDVAQVLSVLSPDGAKSRSGSEADDFRELNAIASRLNADGRRLLLQTAKTFALDKSLAKPRTKK